MRHARPRHLVPAAGWGVLALVLALVMATGAGAYFKTTGTGTASGSVTTLAAPTISSATPGPGTVALNWTAVTPPGASSVSYYVIRDGGTPGGNCPSSSSASGVTTCTDTGVPVGTHQYTVTAVWRSWTAKSATSTVQVTVGPPATHFSLTAATTTSAGVADNVTITALDLNNSTVTGYTGPKTLTFAGAGTVGANIPTVTSSAGTATNFGVATSISFTNGVASASGSSNGVMRLYKAETASITVSDGSISNASGLSVTVNPLAATSLSLAAVTTTPTAGAADNLTMTARDTYGNAATGYAGAKSLTFAGATTIGANRPTVTNSSGTGTNFGAATSISFTSGVASVSGTSNGVMKLYKAESAMITVSDGVISNGSGLPVTVGSASVASISLSVATTTPSAGAADNLTITGLDGYGNGLTGSQSLIFGGDDAVGSYNPTVTNASGTAVAFGTATAITFINGTASVSGSSNGVMKLYEADTDSITVTDGSITNSAVSVTVAPLAAASLSPAATTATPTAGMADNLTFTALDTYGNTATSYTGIKSLTFAGASTIGVNSPTVADGLGRPMSFGTATLLIFTSGVASPSGGFGATQGVMTLYKAESALITVSDGTINNGSGFSVTVGNAAQAPSGLAYVDKNTTTADQVTGTTTPSVSVTATQTMGPSPGSTYTTTSSVGGGFTVNVQAWNGAVSNGSFTYRVRATDAYGNQTASTTVSATDTK